MYSSCLSAHAGLCAPSPPADVSSAASPAAASALCSNRSPSYPAAHNHTSSASDALNAFTKNTIKVFLVSKTGSRQLRDNASPPKTSVYGNPCSRYITVRKALAHVLNELRDLRVQIQDGRHEWKDQRTCRSYIYIDR